jgi:hypothetical protein
MLMISSETRLDKKWIGEYQSEGRKHFHGMAALAPCRLQPADRLVLVDDRGAEGPFDHVCSSVTPHRSALNLSVVVPVVTQAGDHCGHILCRAMSLSALTRLRLPNVM